MGKPRENLKNEMEAWRGRNGGAQSEVRKRGILKLD